MQLASQKLVAVLRPCFIFMIVCGAASHPSIAAGQSAGTFTATGDMTVPRLHHTATLLPNGKVLICGGAAAMTVWATAELYDPTTRAFTATGNMTVPRWFHTATLLP